ncbi:MAG: hypothetical protein Q8R57_10470 [Bacteroidota bacterium]|nr:hypothetical protein [Bacteroidota bacterium]
MKQKLLLLYIACYFFACKPEPERIPNQHNYIYLTAEQLAKTPYFTNPAFDTLTFVSNQNDTVVFAKTRVDSGWFREIDFNPGVEFTSYRYYQQISANYQTIKGEGSFGVKIVKKRQGGGFEVFEYLFNDFKFYDGLNTLNDKSYSRYLGEINLRNKKFTNTMYSLHNYEDSTAFCYINLEKGVFYFNDRNKNNTLLLINE